jgi:iron complex outermembrane receptor protein
MGHRLQRVAFARTRFLRATMLVAGLVGTTAASVAEAQTARPTTEPVGSAIEEVTVTATRRAEPLSKVAISVSTFNAAQMDERGVKSLDDLVRLSPGLNLSRDSATGANQISIRGIASDAGSGTTGVYIDDTPIQVRNLGFGAGNAYPELFDIERVEVLRGPQGTLFGAGSEGGTIRFITTEPSLTQQSQYARAEVATLRNGSPTYEAGVAFGGPITADRLGFRISASYRREGGWIDAVDGSHQVVDATGASYGASDAFTRTSTIEKDVNWNRTVQLRGALKWQPSDSLTINPSIFYQKHYINDGAGGTFDLSTSNLGARDYSRQAYLAGPAGQSYLMPTSTQPYVLNAMNAPNNAFGNDEFTLYAVALSWNLGSVQLVSNTSYFDRTSVQWFDYTKGYAEFYTPQFYTTYPDGSATEGVYAPLGWKAMALYNNAQGNFVEELRLQSNDTASRLSWVAGAFFSHNRQTASEPINNNFMINAPWVGFYPQGLVDFWGLGGYIANPGGPPFGAGSTAYQNFFGDNPQPNAVSFFGRWQTIEKQLAGFAQVDYKILDQLKATVGLRVSRNTLDFDAAYLGPENNANAPFGFPCPVATCTFGSGALAPSYPLSSAHSTETAVTPKFALSYQPNDANLFYGTAAKGFRPAGASLRVPAICDGDLITKGYVDANGNPTQPLTYKSDSVWSYELGSKNRLFGGRLILDGSVYRIKWKNIQTNVSLPACAYNFVDNLADATSDGFDFAFQLKATNNLDFSGSFGTTNPKFDSDAKSPSGVKIYSQGASIPSAGPPSTLSLSGEYHVALETSLQAYLRLDYTRTTEWRRTGNLDPTAVSYDPLLKPVPAYGVFNLRVGARFGEFDLSAFVQNLTDAAPALELFHSAFYDPQDWYNASLRPRTYGLTLTWHH